MVVVPVEIEISDARFLREIALRFESMPSSLEAKRAVRLRELADRLEAQERAQEG